MKPDDGASPPAAQDPSQAWESVFRSLGLPAYRVRVEEKDNMVCIQAPPEDVARLLDPAIRPVLVKHGKSLGYRFVTVDLG
jgi:PP-loop superfamily ATP-utilizing enzyme